MPDAISPGAASGSAIDQNARKGGQPSTCAASLSSGGISPKNAIINHTVMGRFMVTWVRISAPSVSYQPSSRKAMYHGPTSVSTGIMWNSSVQPRNAATTRCAHLNRYSEYAASVPTIRTSAVLVPATIRLLTTLAAKSERRPNNTSA